MIRTRYEALQILGLSPDAGVMEWKSAYRAIIKKCHPDNLPSNMSEKDRQKAGMYCQYAKEAVDFLESEKVSVIDNSRSRIIGSPVRDDNKSVKKVNIPGTDKKTKSYKEAKKEKYEQLQKKGRELRQKEKEQKILDEIRWLRVAQIIKAAIEEDSGRSEKEEKLSEAIRKAIEDDKRK